MASTFISLLSLALQNYADKIESLSIGQSAMAIARQNDKRPAYIQWAIPDEWAMNIGGDKERVNVYVLIKIPREALDEWKEGRGKLIETPKIVLPS